MSTQLFLIFVFASIGIIDTLYLVRHVVTKQPVRCLFFPKAWCEKVQFSKYSRTFGIPNPLLGLLMYIGILICAIAVAKGNPVFLGIQILVGIGFLFSLYFTIIQAFVLRAFCTWCVVSAINFFVMAYATFLM